MYLLTGSSRGDFSRESTNIIAATLVMVLVTEWIGKIASAVIGVAFSTSRLPKHLKYTGWPWCWIKTMAPGILPEAISPLIKSSMAESFSRDKHRVRRRPKLGSSDRQRSRERKPRRPPAAAILDSATFRQKHLLTDRLDGHRLLHSPQNDPDSRTKNGRRRHSRFWDRGLATGQQSSGGVVSATLLC